jgi:hypothetical protein
MGVGLFTYTPSLAFYLYLLACLLSGSTATGGLIGLVYGICFAGAVFVSGWRGRSMPTPAQSGRALTALSRARVAGALVSPLVVAMPGVWPF